MRHLLLRGKKRDSLLPRRFCCSRMEYDLKQKCHMHQRRLDCADNLIYYSARLGEYGLILHDGTGHLITIHFCPWCGARLRGALGKHPQAGRFK